MREEHKQRLYAVIRLQAAARGKIGKRFAAEKCLPSPTVSGDAVSGDVAICVAHRFAFCAGSVG